MFNIISISQISFCVLDKRKTGGWEAKGDAGIFKLKHKQLEHFGIHFNLRLTWYVPCGVEIIEVPSAKMAQQVLSSQFVMTVAKSGFSIRMHFTFLMVTSGLASRNKIRRMFLRRACIINFREVDPEQRCNVVSYNDVFQVSEMLLKSKIQYFNVLVTFHSFWF